MIGIRLLLLLGLAGLLGGSGQPPVPPLTGTDLVNQLQVLVDKLRIEVVIPPIASEVALDARLLVAAPGEVIDLSPTLVYTKLLTITTPVTLQSAVLPGRMDPLQALPTFRDGIAITGDWVTLRGVEVKKINHATDIVTATGKGWTLDRVRILGDPALGAKRGLAANGGGGATIRDSYIDDCFQLATGVDTQAIIVWDMAPGLLIENNFLRAGSETVLLGGADSASVARMPDGVTIRGNTITARPEWMAQNVGVKTRLEIKAGRHVLVESNVVEYCWKKNQDGYALSLTVRNQSGTAPWSTIEDVVIRTNTFQHAADAINILSTDNNFPSGTLARVSIDHNTFSDLRPAFYLGGNAKLIQVTGGATDLTIDANTFSGSGQSTSLYFLSLPQLVRFTATGNTWPTSTYGIFGAGSSVGINPLTGLPKAWEQYVASGTLSGNTVTP